MVKSVTITTYTSNTNNKNNITITTTSTNTNTSVSAICKEAISKEVAGGDGDDTEITVSYAYP